MMMGRTKLRRRTLVVCSLLTMLVSMLLLSGCTERGKASSAVQGLSESIRVMGLQNNGYTDLLYAQYPDVEFVDVKVDTDEMKKRGITYAQLVDEVLERDKPDILTLSISDYERLAAARELYDLSGFIKKDKYDMSDMLPIVKNTLQAKGGGRIYGLSPSFSSSALYYNKKLFDQYGVPYPTDQMSWKDVLALAGKFPRTDGDDRIYGYHLGLTSSPVDLLYQVAQTYGLSYLSADGKRVSLDTPEWQSIASMVMDAYSEDVLAKPLPPKDNGRYEKTDIEQRDLFGAGRAAMTMDTFFLTLGRDIDWGIVTVPVDPARPNATTALTPYPIFAVNAKAANPQAAWEIVKFLNSSNVARIQQNSPIHSSWYSSCVSLLPKEKDGRSLEPLYKLTEYDDRSTIYKYRPEIPAKFNEVLNQAMREELDAVLNGSETVEAALKAVQAKAQRELP